MAEVAHPPDQRYDDQRGDGASAAMIARSLYPDLAADEPGEPGRDQHEEQRRHNDRIDDENDIPLVPAVVEGIEGTEAVVVGKVEQQVTEYSQQCVKIEQSPARSGFG